MWITHPAANSTKPVSLQFRKEIDLARLPGRAPVRVTADNRYVLFVNGSRVAAGPSRGDLTHWRYRSVDLAPYLRRGRNVIAAQVWNDGDEAPNAQISARTGFLLLGSAAAPGDLDSGPAWRVRIDPSRSVAAGPAQIARLVKPGLYYAAGPPETHDATKRRRDWMQVRSDAPDWVAATAAIPTGQSSSWTLVEDRLPAMRHDRLGGGKPVRVTGIPATRFPSEPVVIPANTTATIVIDAGRVQAAYPMLTVSGGAGAEISLTYAEALYGSDQNYLSDRAQVAGGRVLGLTDLFYPDGAANGVFEPFWWRTWRFAEVRVKTRAAPLRLQSFTRAATGYPFVQRARFQSSDPQLNRIWQIGWDTVRLDAHETFMDTAYWEQLQYIGDTRIEALVSYLVSGDARLGVQAIEAFDDSRIDGIPQSRWPSKERQSIPPFALLWIGMLHDYWLNDPDRAPIRRSLAEMRSVLNWYYSRIGSDGLVGRTPGWEFIDWRPSLSNVPWGKTPPTSDTCINTLLYVGALRQAADLEGDIGDPARAQADRAIAGHLGRVVNALCWSAERGLYADTPEKTAFSQHANILAILHDVAPTANRVAILDRITVRNAGIAAPDGISGTTYYFAYYLARALTHAGLGDRYPELLLPWRAMLAKNFTSWPEEPDPTRSDSHAWSAHPTADLLRIVAGIESAAPGYASVRIAPHLGTLRSINAAVASPLGLIEVKYRRSGNSLRASIILPSKLLGEFEWKGHRRVLKSGSNTILIDDAGK